MLTVLALLEIFVALFETLGTRSRNQAFSLDYIKSDYNISIPILKSSLNFFYMKV